MENKWHLVNFCELDKYAVKSYCAIHDVDESLNLGDITKVDISKLPDFDTMTWGFPCTDISVAGKQKGFIDENGEVTRSGLYYEGIKILREKKPILSIIENVKNLVGKKFKNEFEMILSDLEEAGYNNYWQVLNAKNYGVPQNRERVFIVSIRKDWDMGNFKFPEGFDNGIRLKDVLEKEVDEKYYISQERMQIIKNNLGEEIFKNNDLIGSSQKNAYTGNLDFSPSITSACGNGGGQTPMVKQVANIEEEKSFKNPQRGRVYSPDGLSPTLNTCGGGSHEPKIVQKCIDKSNNNPKILRNANCVSSREDRGISNRQGEGTAVLEMPLNPQDDGNCRLLKAQYAKTSMANYLRKGSMGATGVLQLPENSYCLDSNYHKGTTVEQYQKKHRRQIVPDGIRIRKLTPKECFRLMGFDDWDYEMAAEQCSNSQLYKQAGNSIVVDVLYYILLELYKAMPYLFEDIKLCSLFSGIGAFESALDRLYEAIENGNFT